MQVLAAEDEGAGDESIQIIGVKRKVMEVEDDESDLTELDGPEEEVETKAVAHEDLEKLETYSAYLRPLKGAHAKGQHAPFASRSPPMQ